MSVGRICVRDVVVAERDDTAREAAERMKRHQVGTLVVVEEDDVPVGIVTDRDLAVRCVAEYLDPDSARVADVMTSPVRTVEEATPIEDALSLMDSAGVRRLVVTGPDERLAGLLSLDDVLELLAEEVESVGRLLSRYGPRIPTG